MFTGPYTDIYPAVAEVLKELIRPEDTYHITHTRRIARTLQVLLDQKPKGRILELGTGGVITLAIQALLPKVTIDVTNFDMNKETVHTYETAIHSYSGSFTAFAIDLESDEIPVKDETYDWVICSEVIEHMDIDPMFMMSEVNRVLKPKGSLLLTTPNVVSSRGLTKMMSGLEPYFYMQYHANRSPYRHNYEYSIHSLMQVVRAAGFDGSIWTEDCFEDSMPSVVARLNAAGFNITHTGDNIFTIAKKKSPVLDRYPQAIYEKD
jgi:2-polyprenyl-3-methyl-5-hydroxy-6-metoxy-1,4-benzoquinol methylase